MPSGNVCRANERRARQQKADAAAGKATTAEDRKKLEQYKNSMQCTVCLQGFPNTVRLPELEQHAEKHAKLGKTIADLFPNFQQ
mmetsp:Transcript_70319/g.81957  ORF Transcript_70319/g.81957 Transcript_70319/m.81957 type:complete len:84 (-) Transcript_70319:122-373(-)